MFHIDFKSRVPIFKQVLDNFKQKIYKGELVPDERVPSIRELAKTLGVNPNTVQKAYRELEEKGFFYTVQGQGSFIASPLEEQKKEEIENIFVQMKKLKDELIIYGVEEDEIFMCIKGGTQ